MVPCMGAPRAGAFPPASRPWATLLSPCRKEGNVQRSTVEGEQTKTGMQKETVSVSPAGPGEGGVD